jgi:hypothetical protein
MGYSARNFQFIRLLRMPEGRADCRSLDFDTEQMFSLLSTPDSLAPLPDLEELNHRASIRCDPLERDAASGSERLG